MCTNGDIRLLGGQVQSEGRVEVCVNKAWGTVCDDVWTTSDANVACKQAGFSGSGKREHIHVATHYVTKMRYNLQMLLHTGVHILVKDPHCTFTLISCSVLDLNPD